MFAAFSGLVAVLSLRDSASSGDRLSALEVLRDVLAAQIEATDSARDVAALSKQFRETLVEIERLSSGAKQEGSVLDEFSKRLADRRANAARKSGS